MSKGRKYIEKIRDKYYLKIFNESTLEEVWSYHLSRLNVFAYVGFISLLLIVIVTLIIALTPLREYIPGYPDGSERRISIRNTEIADSLERQYLIREKYVENFRNILLDSIPIEKDTVIQDSSIKQEVDFTKSPEDSIFRAKIEEEEKYNVAILKSPEIEYGVKDVPLYPPIKGLISHNFDYSIDHFGVDLVAAENELIHAVLDGTIIISTWTSQTGYVIQVQHDNNLVSMYKHNSKLLKSVGEKVLAGDPIAVIGNSGEISTGTHLHFELWHNGTPLNPVDFLKF